MNRTMTIFLKNMLVIPFAPALGFLNHGTLRLTYKN